MDELLRHKLFNKLETVLGVEDAAVLIEHLPPMGWADLATRRDTEQLAARLDSLSGDVRDLRAEFVSLRSDISIQFRTTVFAMMGMMVTLSGLVSAAVRLG